MNERMSPPAVGGTSLLVMFAVLCLTVFALLGLSSVQADGRLSDAAAEAVSAYYQADCRAEEVLAALRSGTVPEGVERDGSSYYYKCPISDTQTLEVAVQVEGTEYRVLKWQAVPTGQWEADQALDVWDGQIPE